MNGSYKKKIIIIISLIIFLITRLGLLFYSPYVFEAEEFKVGSLGRDIVFEKKLSLPIFGYLDTPHSGGSIVAVIQVIPFYLLFGNIYFNYRLCYQMKININLMRHSIQINLDHK